MTDRAVAKAPTQVMVDAVLRELFPADVIASLERERLSDRSTPKGGTHEGGRWLGARRRLFAQGMG